MSGKVIYLGEDRFSADWLRGVTENQAVHLLKAGHPVSQIKNAWKQANGFSKPKYDSTQKPKAKPKARKKKAEAK
jgi:hypothetical protein